MPLSRRDAIRSGVSAVAGLVRAPDTIDRLVLGATAPDRPYLIGARKAAAWISEHTRRDAAGASWAWDPADATPAVQTNLYSGTPGIVLFFLEMHAATGDATYRDLASAGADYLSANLPADIAGEGAGLYTGLAGIGWTLAVAARVTKAETHRATSVLAFDRLKAGARPAGAGAT